MSGSQGFWARRRAAVAAEVEARARDAEETAAASRAAALEEKSDAEILDELDLPDPDTLGEGEDYRAFMHRSVPLRLRQRALRRLWRPTPALARPDGLNDHDGDHAGAATAASGPGTDHAAGRGPWRGAKVAADSAGPAVAGPMAAEAPAPEGSDPEPPPEAGTAGSAPDAHDPQDPTAADEAPRPLRMACRFP